MFFLHFCYKESCTKNRSAHFLHMRTLKSSFLILGSTFKAYKLFPIYASCWKTRWPEPHKLAFQKLKKWELYHGICSGNRIFKVVPDFVHFYLVRLFLLSFLFHYRGQKTPSQMSLVLQKMYLNSCFNLK